MTTLALAVGVCASAQTFQPRQPRPEWGIFASGVSKTEQRLILTATFGGGYEDDLSAAPPPLDDGTLPTSPYYTGPFGSAGASLRYHVNKKKVQSDVGFGAYGRNYRDQTDHPFVSTYSADGTIGAQVSKNGSLSSTFFAGQYIQNLSPFGYDTGGGGWGTAGVPGLPTSPGPFTTGDTYRGFGLSASYNHNVSEKISLYGGYSAYANEAWSTDVQSNLYGAQYVSGGMRYALGKGLSLRAGYSSTFAGFASDAANYKSRTIDASLDYNKSLSLTRRGSLTFGTGVSGLFDQAGNIHYYLVGNANFSYELGRTWSAYASVNRFANFYQTLGQPTISDWFAGGVNGTIGRRIDVNAGVSYQDGAAIGTNSQLYDATSAFASLRVGLNRVLAVNANYAYYRYGFTNDVLLLPPGFVRQTDRQTIQVSLVVWAPLMTKTPAAQSRSANASR